MRIEKKYHTQAAKEWDELVREEEKKESESFRGRTA